MSSRRPVSRPWRAAALALALAGCAVVGRDYRAPALPAPGVWHEAAGQTENATSVTGAGSLALARWWAVFRDPILDSLMEKAVAANPDLRVAEARLREARAQRGVVAGGEWPNAEATGAAQRLRDNKPPAPPNGVVASLFQAGFDAGWEIDLFGGVRRAVEAADAGVGGAEEDLRSALVSLLAEVARYYIEARGLQRQLAVARDTIATQRETLAVSRARFDAGLTSEFDVTRAEAQLAAVEAQVPSLDAGLRRSLHRLAVLVGQEPGALVGSLSEERPIPVPPAEVAVGLPSDLLLRRPDVRRAERELAAATARVGVAEADLFPRFSLTGSFGLQALHFQDFADWSSRVWSVGPAFRWPIFEGGRIRSNVRVQNERQEQALIRYEKAFLTALEDVENAIVSWGREEDRRRSLATATAANARALETANALYRAGLAEFLQVLDAQRSLHSTQSQLAQSETAVASNLVALYKALGGGWVDDVALQGSP